MQMKGYFLKEEKKKQCISSALLSTINNIDNFKNKHLRKKFKGLVHCRIYYSAMCQVSEQESEWIMNEFK